MLRQRLADFPADDLLALYRELRATREALTGPWRFAFTAVRDTEPFIERDITMLLLSSVQKAALSIRPVDRKGNPAPVDGVPAWSASDEGVVALVVAPDGMSAVVAAVGPTGQAQVNVVADADLGAGVVTIAGALDVTVQPAQAVALAIEAGPAEDQ